MTVQTQTPSTSPTSLAPAVSLDSAQDKSSYVDSYQPPAPQASISQSPKPYTPAPQASMPPKPQDTSPATTKSDQDSQSLHDQNIFFLLGVKDGTDEEKEAFLDELQQVIWEDFLESDVKLLITAEEMIKLREMMAKGDGQAEQEEMIVYLEKLIPDLEEIMLEKALELKSDLFKERIAGMREYHLGNQAALDNIDEAKKLIDQTQWKKAAEILNAVVV
ncbi:hypothetical protein KKE34_01530 [Patescibacteria group bacterium]|nr:hypothetical protein [Patescibacteria group bacterium]